MADAIWDVYVHKQWIVLQYSHMGANFEMLMVFSTTDMALICKKKVEINKFHYSQTRILGDALYQLDNTRGRLRKLSLPNLTVTHSFRESFLKQARFYSKGILKKYPKISRVEMYNLLHV